MSSLKAGVGRSKITPRDGVNMIGYFNRPGVSQGVHDDLHARAIVLDNGVEQVIVDAAVGADEPPATGLPADLLDILGEQMGATIPLDIRLVGIGSAVLLGQPGEIFSATAIEFRNRAQGLRHTHPMLISYANDCYAYIPPANAFPEGGYEVSWPLRLGISRYTQDRIAAAIDPLLKQRAPRLAHAMSLRMALTSPPRSITHLTTEIQIIRIGEAVY